jgi:hypothetical protein
VFPYAAFSRLFAKLGVSGASPNTQVRKIEEAFQVLNEVPRMGELEKRLEEQVKELDEQKKRIEILSCASRYSTRDEYDVGNIILRDTENGILTRLELPTQTPKCSLQLACSFVDVSPSETHEDKVINEPMLNLLQFLLEHKQINMKALDCTLSSPFVDARGREQRGDQVLVSYGDLEEGSAATWPMAVTFFEGKHDLQTGNFRVAIGQCQRRCDAILEQQSWRKYVISVFHCLNQIGFLKLDESRKPSISRVMPFVRKGEDGNLVKEEGFHILMQLMESDFFGWLPCPYSLVLSSASALESYSRAQAVCARSSGKKVFVVQGRAGGTRIVKAAEEARMLHEHRVLQHLRGVVGILDVSDLFTVDIQYGTTKMPTMAMLMEQCTVVTPSSATPKLFAQYAQILMAASNLGVHHNDISLDNLLCKQVSGQVTGIIIDWEHATLNMHEMKGFRGKHSFAPDCAFEREWIASLQNDLESLFYVAVSCCVEDELEWPRIKDDTKMCSKRRDECGLYFSSRKARTASFATASEDCKALWGNYLEGIRMALLEARRNPALAECLTAAWLSDA